MSRFGVTLLTAVVLALAAGPAHAATVSVEDDPRCAGYDCWVSPLYVTEAGEATDLTIAGAPTVTAVLFHDEGAELGVGLAAFGQSPVPGPIWQCTAAGRDAACTLTPGLVCYPVMCGVSFGFDRAVVDARATQAKIRTAGVPSYLRTGAGTNLVDVRGGEYDQVFCEPGNDTRVLADTFDNVDVACAQIERDERAVVRARGDVLGVPYSVSAP